jgi:hypothetical protein
VQPEEIRKCNEPFSSGPVRERRNGDNYHRGDQISFVELPLDCPCGALAAFMFALYQVQTGRYHPAVLVFTAIVLCLITARVFVNFWRYGRK